MIVTLTQSEIEEGLQQPNAVWAPAQFTFSVPQPGATWIEYTPGVGQLHEPFSAGYSVLNTIQANAFRAAIAVWDALIAPDFIEVIESGEEVGNVRAAFTDTNIVGNWGYAYAPFMEADYAPLGDIWIDDAQNTSSFTVGGYDWEAILHEIGHAIGLKHPFEAPVIPVEFENRRYSILSYTNTEALVTFSSNAGGGISSRREFVNSATPQVLDIAAIQSRYGAETTTASGDTIYTMSQATTFTQAIYDAGGYDTIDTSGFTRPSVIDLRPGAYSSIGFYSIASQIADTIARFGGFTNFITNQLSMPNTYTWSGNLGIALNTVIEAARGGAGDDQITGNLAANLLEGNGGADWFSGAEGSDRIDGGAGVDTAAYGSNAGAIFVDLATGRVYESALTNSQVLGSTTFVSTDLLTSIERVEGSDYSDRFYGTSGNDVFAPGMGNDLLYGLGGIDTVDYSTAVGAVFVDMAARFASETGLRTGTVLSSTPTTGRDVFFDFENVIGSNFGDRLYGSAGDNVIAPGAGADIAYGLGGTDTLSYASAGGAVFVDLTGRFVLETALTTGTVLGSTSVTTRDLVYDFESAIGSAFGDRLYGTATSNSLDGGAGADKIYGLAGNDFLLGGAGADELIGGNGVDTLTGGAGADRFFFIGNETGGSDVITDFETGVDDLYLVASAFGYAAGATAVLVINGPAVTANSFTYNTTTGVFAFDADGAGAGAAVTLATLTGAPVIGTADIVFYG